MSRKPALVKRLRRRLWGGTVDMRFYADGSARVHTNHPSNDPEIELAMGGRAFKVIREAYKNVGFTAAAGPIVWRDDP